VADQADFAVILPAAGRGSRFGGDKLSRSVAGRSILEHSIRAFIDRPDVAAVVVVRDLSLPPAISDDLGPNPKLLHCAGGPIRAQSVANGLRRLEELAKAPDFVAVHDAARPAVTQGLIDRVFAAARQQGAAVPGMPVTDTIKRISGGRVVETLPRSELVAVQTPQAMRRHWLAEALAAWPSGLETVTDDVQLLESIGMAAVVVEGEACNVKVTREADLAVVESVLRANSV
jgi:2-C-methyl-D-erythritol 4-phosphate cytidylyltransferase